MNEFYKDEKLREKRRQNHATHSVAPCPCNEELGCCTTCHAGEAELEDHSCSEYLALHPPTYSNSDLPPLANLNQQFAASLATARKEKADIKAGLIERPSCIQAVADRERRDALYFKWAGKTVLIQPTKRTGVVVGVDPRPQRYTGAPHPPVNDYLVIAIGSDHVTALEHEIQEITNS